MNLKDVIQLGLFNEYSKGMSAGNRVWDAKQKRVTKAIGKVASGKGVVGKIPMMKDINKKALSDILGNRSKQLTNPMFSKPTDKEKRLGIALGKASQKVLSRWLVKKS